MIQNIQSTYILIGKGTTQCLILIIKRITYSINVQLEVLMTYIWAHSIARQTMETLSRRHPNEYYLLGDSGYMLRPWLQIPIHNPEPGSPQERYNNMFKTVRSIIEQCNGLLKMRFRFLLRHRVLHYTATKSSKIINACVVLHNLCIMYLNQNHTRKAMSMLI